MGAGALLARRARAHLGLLTTIAALLAVIAALVAGTVGYSQAAAVAGAREALSTADPTNAGLLAQTRLGEDPAAQDARAREVIHALFGPSTVHIRRSLRTEPLALAGHEDRVVVDTIEDARGLIEVLDGRWPAGEAPTGVPGALHVQAAEALGLAVGDSLALGAASSRDGVAVEVVALWEAVDPQDRAWFGDALVAGGTDGDVYGPLLMTETSVAELDTAPFVRWTVMPDPSTIEPDDLDGLVTASEALHPALSDDPAVPVRGLTVEGALATTSGAVGSDLRTARALGMVPLALLVLVSGIALLQLARLLARTRSTDVELMVARGASPGQLVRWSALEAAVLAVLGVGAGTGAALLVLQGVDQGGQQAPTVLRTGLLLALGGLAVLTVVAAAQARATARRSQVDRSGRTRAVAALGTLVLTLAAAALSLWQLRRYGSPLVTGDDGTTRTDLVAAVGPAAGLVAVAVVGMALLGPVGRLVEQVARRPRSLTPSIAARQVARRLPVYVVPVVLIVLAVGATTISSLYAGTSAQLRSSLSELRHGTDVRVTLGRTSTVTTGSPTPTAGPYAALEGADAAAAVLRDPVTVGEAAATLTAVPMEGLDAVMQLPEGSLRPGPVAGALAGAPLEERQPGITVPEGASALELDLTVSAHLLEQVVAELDELDRILRESSLQEEEQPTTYGELRYDPDWVQHTLDRVQGLSTLLWVADQDGVLSLLDAGVLPLELTDPRDDDGGGPVTASAHPRLELPGQGPHRIVGLEIEAQAVGLAYELDYRIEAIRATTQHSPTPEDLLADPSATSMTWGAVPATASRGWQLLDPGQPLGLRARLGHDQALSLDATQEQLRLAPGADFRPQDGSAPPGGSAPQPGPAEGDPTSQSAPSPVPVAFTTELAERLDLSVGDVVGMHFRGAGLDVQLAHLVDAVPGGLDTLAALVDLPSLQDHLLRTRSSMSAPGQVWIGTGGQDPDPALRTAAREVAGEEATVTVVDAVAVTDAASSVRTVFWVAAAGAVLLAVAGVGAVAGALLRTRRSEVMVLRALGMAPGAQAWARAGELVGVSLAAVLVGLAAGWLVSALTVPELARSTTSSTEATLPAPLLLEAAPWTVLVVVTAGGLLAGAVVVAARVRSQALDREYREEIR